MILIVIVVIETTYNNMNYYNIPIYNLIIYYIFYTTPATLYLLVTGVVKYYYL